MRICGIRHLMGESYLANLFSVKYRNLQTNALVERYSEAANPNRASPSRQLAQRSSWSPALKLKWSEYTRYYARYALGIVISMHSLQAGDSAHLAILRFCCNRSVNSIGTSLNHTPHTKVVNWSIFPIITSCTQVVHNLRM